MASIITTDFSIIHNALNNLILGEVKAALRLLDEQMYQDANVCRIVVSHHSDYEPKDVAVDCVWLDNDKLCLSGHVMPIPDDGNIEPEEWKGDEDKTDWYDITDFHYLIEEMRKKMPDGEHDLTNNKDAWNVVSAVGSAVGMRLNYKPLTKIKK